MYVDPTGEFGIIASTAIVAIGGGLVSMGGLFVSDLVSGKRSSWQEYAGSFVGGAVGSTVGFFGGGLGWSNLAGSVSETATTELLNHLTIENYETNVTNASTKTIFGFLTGVMVGGLFGKVGGWLFSDHWTYMKHAAEPKYRVPPVKYNSLGEVLYGKPSKHMIRFDSFESLVSNVARGYKASLGELIDDAIRGAIPETFVSSLIDGFKERFGNKDKECER